MATWEDRIVDLVLARLFTVARAKADAEDGEGQIEGIAGEGPPCEHAALPGFSSGIVPEDELLVLRRRDGAVSLVSLTHCPNEEAGDRNVWTADGMILRLRHKVLTILDPDGMPVVSVDTAAGTVTLAQGTKFVVLNGDNVVPDASFVAHVHTGGTIGGLTGPVNAAPPVLTIGTCTTSASKTKAG